MANKDTNLEDFDLTSNFFLEKKIVTVSSKRQFTIPKSYMDEINNPKQFNAYMLKDGTILLEPKEG